MNLSTDPKQTIMEEKCIQNSKKLHSTFSVSSLLSNNSSSRKKSSKESSVKNLQKCYAGLKSPTNSFTSENIDKDIKSKIEKSDPESVDIIVDDLCQSNDSSTSVPNVNDRLCQDVNAKSIPSETPSGIASIPKCLSVNFLCQKDNLDSELSLVTTSIENMSSKDLLGKSSLEPKPGLSWYNCTSLCNRIQPYASETGFKWEQAYDMQIPKIPLKNNVFCNFGWLNKYSLDNVNRLSPTQQVHLGGPTLINDAQSVAPVWLPCLPCNSVPTMESSLHSK